MAKFFNAIKTMLIDWERLFVVTQTEKDEIATHLVTEYDLGLDEAAEMVDEYVKENAEELDYLETIDQMAEVIYNASDR